jgi:NAD-dependent dihydropyrimidine dehydrogenase PreA subunit
VRVESANHHDQQRALAPRIDPNKCKGKGSCVKGCPEMVLQVDQLTVRERGSLTFRGSLRAWHHHNRQARVVDPARCTACGKCARICPKGAITLTRHGV